MRSRVRYRRKLSHHFRYATSHRLRLFADASGCDLQVVVLTDIPLSQQLEINDFTHDNGVKFISTDVRGLFSSVFCDFGPKFPCIDPNGEAPVQGMVVEVEKVRSGPMCVVWS